MAVHDPGVELVGMHLALGRDQHVADHAQAIHIGVQRAQAVGQLLGQHGNHAAREIDTGGAVVGIDVDGIAVLHIVAHIGNRHQQAPPLGTPDLGRLAIHGIVEVARILAIDGAQRHIAQVHTAFAVLGHDLFRQRLSRCQTGFRKHMRHAIFAHRDLDFHTGVIDLAQHFHDAPHGLPEQRRRLCQLHHHHLARLGLAGGPLRHQHILAVALVFRRHQPHATFL